MTKITIIVNGKEIEAEINDSDLEKIAGEKEWPQEGDMYYFIYGDGAVDMDFFEEYTSDIEYKRNGNFFKTKEHAELYKKYLEYCAIVPDGVEGEDFYVYNFHAERVTGFDMWNVNFTEKKFSTEELCEAANLEQYREAIEFVTQRKY